MRFDRAIPILRIFSVERAREFYLDFLGFSVDFEHRFEPGAPLFMKISRGGLALYLSEHHGDGSPGIHVTIEMQGVDAYHAEISAKGYAYIHPGIEETPWGSRDMSVIDPTGNHLCFSEKMESPLSS